MVLLHLWDSLEVNYALKADFWGGRRGKEGKIFFFLTLYPFPFPLLKLPNIRD